MSARFALAVAAAALGTAARADDPKPALKAGGELPFLVADFEAGPDKGHCGCPSVMIRNHGARGLVVWSRTADAWAFEVARGADALVDGKAAQGYLVLFDVADKDRADRLRTYPLTNVTAGPARHGWAETAKAHGLDPKAACAVALIDDRVVKALWVLGPDELTAEKRDAVLKDVKNHLKPAK